MHFTALLTTLSCSVSPPQCRHGCEERQHRRQGIAEQRNGLSTEMGQP